MLMYSGDIPRAEVVDNPVPTINEGIPGMTFHRQTKALIGTIWTKLNLLTWEQRLNLEIHNSLDSSVT